MTTDTGDKPVLPKQTPKLLRTHQVAARYNLSKSWFEKLRVSGDGPEFISVSNVILYDPDVVDAWFAKHRRKSTSEAA